MPSHHDDVEIMSGDNAVIVGTLLDADGNPFDLTDAEIAWTLIYPDGETVEVAAMIMVIDPPTAGILNIKLSAITTAMFPCGCCQDALRVRVVGFASTLWTGTILVAVNPFAP